MIAWTAIAGAAEVTLDGATWVALQPPQTPVPVAPGPLWARRDVTLVSTGDALHVESTWTVIVPEEAWASAALTTDAMRLRGAWLDGTTAAVIAEGGELRWVGRLTAGVHRLVLSGVLVGDPAASDLSIPLAPAAAGAVRFSTDGGQAGIPLGDGLFAGAGPTIAVSVRPDTPAADAGPVARADVGIGIVLGDAVAAVAARLTWTVERGTLLEVSFDVPGAGPDLQVTGGDLASWTRSGDRVTAVLGHAATRQVHVEARWTSPISGEAVDVPRVTPVGVRRTRAALQVARDGDLEPVADLDGWTEISSHQIPDWAEGLAPGAPVGAWTAPQSAGGRIALLHFEPTGGPPAIVDVAAWEVASTEEGRILLSGRLEVRNDRAAWLRVVPPPGASILAARVDGKTALVAGDDTGWWVPLARSVETVDGLLSFPVELVVLGAADAWKPGDNAVVLPTFDAPVAVTRATLHLPPGWESRAKVGERHVVDAFSEGQGITYGLASSVEQQKADAFYQTAVNAWKDNDFTLAEQALEDARALGADNENLRKLQGNVDLVTGKEDAPANSVAERRVLEQAKARSFEDANRQEEVLKQARDAELAGDYDTAEESYNVAKQLGDKLQRLDSSKAERGAQNEALDQKVSEIAEKKKGKAAEVDREIEHARVTIDFEGDDIAGELVRPEGTERDGDGVVDSIDALPQEVATEGEGQRWVPPLQPNFGAAAPPVEAPPPPDVASTTTATVIDEEFLEKVPTGRSYEQVLQAVPGVSRGGGRGSGGKRGEVGGAASTAPPVVTAAENAYVVDGAAKPALVVVEAQQIQILGGGLDAPVVAATTMSVVVPTQGEAVLVQQLLLPPGEQPRFEIPARLPRRNR
jgi:hypothetical protein